MNVLAKFRHLAGRLMDLEQRVAALEAEIAAAKARQSSKKKAVRRSQQ